METQDDWKIPKKHPNKVVVTPENIYIGARTYMTIWSDDAECDEVISHASNEFRVYDSSERLSIQKRYYSVALYFMPGYEPEGEHWKRINKPTSKPTEGVIVTPENAYIGMKFWVGNPNTTYGPIIEINSRNQQGKTATLGWIRLYLKDLKFAPGYEPNGEKWKEIHKISERKFLTRDNIKVGQTLGSVFYTKLHNAVICEVSASKSTYQVIGSSSPWGYGTLGEIWIIKEPEEDTPKFKVGDKVVRNDAADSTWDWDDSSSQLPKNVVGTIVRPTNVVEWKDKDNATRSNSYRDTDLKLFTEQTEPESVTKEAPPDDYQLHVGDLVMRGPHWEFRDLNPTRQLPADVVGTVTRANFTQFWYQIEWLIQGKACDQLYEYSPTKQHIRRVAHSYEHLTADNLIKSQSMTPKDCSEIPIEKKTKTNLTVESEVNLILPSKTKQFNY
jgi:hypothetical protein